MATFKAIVFQTGRHIKQDGTSNIKIRIYHNRESQYIATSYYIQPGNMESKLIKNLYFIGEVLDLDAVTGGYNLQIAWSTAYLAATDVCRNKEEDI